MVCCEWKRALEVVLNAKPLLVAACQKPRSRRDALRGCRVTALENNPIANELIHVGRPNIGIASLQTEVRPTVVVTVNQQNIWGGCGSGRLKTHAG